MTTMACDHSDQGGIAGVDGLSGDDGWFDCDQPATIAIVFNDGDENSGALSVLFSCDDHITEDLHEIRQSPPEALWTMHISQVQQVI